MTNCIKPAVHNFHQVCSSQIASSFIKPAVQQLSSSLQFTTCIKPAVHNLQQGCSSQFAARLQFTSLVAPAWYYQAGASDPNASWYRLDHRKFHKVCSRPAATCAFLAVYLFDINQHQIKWNQSLFTHLGNIISMLSICVFNKIMK
jgi:hypothetical protein